MANGPVSGSEGCSPACSFQHEKDSMVKSPDDKCPTGSMPQSAQEENHHEIETVAKIGTTISSEWNIKVVPEPTGEGNMPAPPEVLDGLSNVGEVEIFYKLEPKHFAHADGHVRVA